MKRITITLYTHNDDIREKDIDNMIDVGLSYTMLEVTDYEIDIDQF